MATPNPDHNPGKNWMSVRGKGAYAPYENDEAKDPRNYVTDPDIDALMLINPQDAATESDP